MDMIQTADFWLNLIKIIWINIILSGDNAVVIAMAARTLPPKEKKMAIIIGSAVAVVLLVALTIGAAQLMELPYLELVGGALLLWIGVKLLSEEEDGEEDAIQHTSLWAAVRTILIADLVMSLDNVIGVAAAAKGSILLLCLGLAVSIPVVVFSSALMINIMNRFPIIITLGAALIGWVGGESMIGDAVIRDFIEATPALDYAVPAACALLVVGLGRYLQHKSESNHSSNSEG
jgi:YjbE family integral membrane protein